MLAYIADRAFILGAGIGLVLVPAISLTLVSFDWNYVTVDESSATAPSAYWIQLYMVLFQIEVIDCLAVCDGTFMLAYFGMAMYTMCQVKRGKNKKWEKMMDIGMKEAGFYRFKCVMEIVGSFCCISLLAVFIMVLFEFGESGFFSPTNNINAGFLIMWSLFVKMFVGFRIIGTAKDDRYYRIKKIFESLEDDEMLNGRSEENYAMETIQVTTTPDTDNITR